MAVAGTARGGGGGGRGGGSGPFAVKNAETLVADTQTEGAKLKRAVGAGDLTAIGLGAIIGTGIFVVIGEGVATAGPAVILSFILAGVTCFFSALSYAELASSIPVSGSAYTYAYATLGEVVAWIIGWDLILEYGVSVAAVAVGWGANLNAFLDNTFGFALPESIATSPQDGGIFNLPAVFIVLAVTALLLRGAKESARVNSIMVIIKLLVLAFFIIVAITIFNPDNVTTNFAPQGFTGVREAAAIIFFAYIGFDAISTGAEEAREPRRDIPLAITGALGIATVLYILTAVFAVGALPAAQLAGSDAPLAEAMERGAGISWAASLVAGGALVAITSVMVAVFYGQTRIMFAMSRDGLFPRRLAAVNPRSGVPARLTLIFGVFIAFLAALVPLSEIVKLVNIGTLFAFVLVNLGVIILRRTRPDMNRPFRVPFSPVFPAIGVILCLYLMLQVPFATWVRFVLWLAIGLAIYYFYGYKNSVLRAKRTDPGEPGLPPSAAGR